MRTFSIRDLSLEFGVTPRAIRFYETEGLLAPERRGAQRIYTSQDRRRLAAILKGKRVGFSLAEIRDMLSLYDMAGGAPDQLRRALDVFERRIADLERQRADLESSLDELRRGRAQIEIALAERGVRVRSPVSHPKFIGFGLQPAED